MEYLGLKIFGSSILFCFLLVFSTPVLFHAFDMWDKYVDRKRAEWDLKHKIGREERVLSEAAAIINRIDNNK